MTQTKRYKDPTGGEHLILPRIWNNIAPFTEKVAMRHGWTAVTVEVAEAAVPRRFSKLKLVTCLKEQGIWTDVRQAVADAGYEDEFLAAGFLEEGNPLFEAMSALLQAKFPDIVLGDVLDGCVQEGQEAS